MVDTGAAEERMEQLYREMFPKLYLYAVRILSQPLLAEEAVQNTFCIACERREKLFGSSNPQGWLMNTLKNVIRNMQRERARMEVSLLAVTEASGAATTDELDVDLLYADLSATEDFQLLKWVALDNCSLREVADRLGISFDASKKRVQRARKRLRKNMKND